MPTPLYIALTGGHSGIGLEFARLAEAAGHRVSLIARSEDRVEPAREAGLSIHRVFEADLADATQRRRVAAEVDAALPQLDVLVNNAAVLLPDVQWSPQGNEMHYEVNTLAPLDLMDALHPALARSHRPRVVNVVSDPMDSPRDLDLETLLRPTSIRKLFGSYMESKRALALATAALAATDRWSGMTLVSVTPGANKTPMTAGDGMPGWLRPLRALFFSPPSRGAARLAHAAFADPGPSGSFLRRDRVVPLRASLPEEMRSQLLAGALGP